MGRLSLKFVAMILMLCISLSCTLVYSAATELSFFVIQPPPPYPISWSLKIHRTKKRVYKTSVLLNIRRQWIYVLLFHFLYSFRSG